MSNESRIYEKTKSLSPIEKIHLVEKILSDLDRPDEQIAQIWLEEASRRWSAYQAGDVETKSHQEVMNKYSR